MHTRKAICTTTTCPLQLIVQRRWVGRLVSTMQVCTPCVPCSKAGRVAFMPRPILRTVFTSLTSSPPSCLESRIVLNDKEIRSKLQQLAVYACGGLGMVLVFDTGQFNLCALSFSFVFALYHGSVHLFHKPPSIIKYNSSKTWLRMGVCLLLSPSYFVHGLLLASPSVACRYLVKHSYCAYDLKSHVSSIAAHPSSGMGLRIPD
ncbi:hypothetical protein B0J13DRAFT_52024 [Dactylonectria estremocensis]|uniref:Uncharacterized protein n=1 Tax=Dactylonectria estremocensis TaxID=1079267 RepID=A0A9P9EPB9_9HYPO|nr:hypothetical protein B0J13DRAFT_52024 [Dactylonectria estremocensis]